ncbi:TonB-dependent receptor [Methylopila jiangsuensis]|uniref:TonB-dependent receptor n=1 Tax=Methylopila jiangsuensis TaxID=586230 RepID=A0A9W6N358_9HYPH|nr:TonB-dependent siderophore receptor [Methylopila jiangsuensis]MDR6285974.1 iron complex outermembrane receptor protein [Methylopila jiangsuensis]GLK75732.1 TonB-dependent receptor [Methylopila jiangsuensis]
MAGRTGTWRRRAAAFALAGASLCAAAGQVQAEDRVRFSIPAGPLGAALTQWAEASGRKLLSSGSAVRGVRTSGVQGNLPPTEALRVLLEGTGLSYENIELHALTLVQLRREGALTAQDATELAEISVEGAGQGVAPQGYAASVSPGATKSGAPLVRTPRVVNVVTQKQMEDQGAQTVTQALRYTPGVVTQYGDTDSRYDWLTVRGFTPRRYLDGLRLPFGARGYSQARIEPNLLESVEVLKGPASGLYGQSNPGGLLAMTSKTPTETARGEIELLGGSHDRKQAAFDVSGPLDADGRFLYRLIGLARDADTQVDHVEDDKLFIAPSFTWKPTESTTLTLLGHYQKIDDKGGGAPPALPAIGTLYPSSGYGKLPSSTFTGEPSYDRFVNEQWFMGYKLSHELSDGWTLRQNLRYGEVDTHTRRVQSYCFSAATCLPTNLLRYAWAFPERSQMFTVDNQAEGRFSTGELEHTLLVGADFTREKAAYRESNLAFLNLGNYNAFDPGAGLSVTEPAVATRIDAVQRQLGLYLQDTITWRAWTLQAGARYDWAKNRTATETVSTHAISRVTADDEAFTGSIGLSYRFDNGVAPFVGYSTSFLPVAGVDVGGDPFKPSEGEQVEAGVKYQPDGFDGLVSLSAFHLTQTNAVTTNPTTGAATQTGEITVKGVEFEGKANLGHGFEGIVSYAYTDAEITRTTAATQLGNRPAFVPKHQAGAWLNYSFGPGAADGLSLGGGARYFGASFGNEANQFKTPGVTLFDASLRYDLGRKIERLKGVSLQVNASNILDKKYVSTCLAAYGCNYGDRRTVYATMKYRW